MRKASNLGPWLNPPVIMDAVIAFLRAADAPVTMREAAVGCALPVSSASRVLYRLHKAGRVTRYKLPMQRPGYCHKTKVSVPGAARRWLFTYSWMKGPLI